MLISILRCQYDRLENTGGRELTKLILIFTTLNEIYRKNTSIIPNLSRI